jgi:TP901 family phage tail tape measure protein
MAEKVISLYGELNLEDNMTNALKTAKRETKSFSDQIKDAGKSVTSLGQDMIRISAPLVGGFGLAIKSAMDFDRAMTNAAAILGNSRDEMVGLNAEILRIGSESIAGPQAVAEAFYDIVSGVADASLHMDILNQSIALSEAGSASLAASTASLIATMNSYGFAAEDAAFVSDVFTRTVGMGVLTMDELAAAMPSVTGMAAAMGIELDTLGGYMAFMTTKGVSASEASTLLRGAMSALLNPTGDLSKAIREMGYESGEAMVAALGLDGAYAKIREYGDGSFAGLITSQEALRAGLILTDQDAKQFFDNFKTGVNGATEAARAIQLDSVSAQFDKLKSGISGIGITVGMALLPALNDLLLSLQPVITEMSNWVAQNPEAIHALAGLALGAMALGVVLTPVGWLINGFATIMAGAVVIGTNAATVAVWGFNAAVAVATSPITWLVAAIAGLLAVLGSGEGGLLGGFQRATVAARQLVEIGIYFILGALAELSNSPLFTTIRNVFESVFNGIKNIVEGVVNSITGFLGQISSGIENVLRGLGLIKAEQNSIFDSPKEILSPSNLINLQSGLGGRADGGPVMAGMPYKVGERGQEWFVPQTNGTIFNQRQMAGMGGISIGTLVLNGVQDVNALYDQLRKVARQRT